MVEFALPKIKAAESKGLLMPGCTQSLLKFLLVASILSMISASATADEPPQISPDLLNVLHAPQHKDAVIKAAQQSTSWIKTKCKDASLKNMDQVSIFKPIQFDEQNSPIAGAWLESVMAEGCGLSKRLNVLTVVTAPKVLHTATLLPGTTRADPVLQKDGVHFASLAAPAPNGCQEGYVSDTRFIGYDHETDAKSGAKRSWQEEWTLVQCEKSSDVTVHFIPDATGTTVTANLK